MSTAQKIQVNYVTSSNFKQKENELFVQKCQLADGRIVGDVFEFLIRAVPIKEVLEIDLQVLVMAEASEAYSQIRVPCVVEHAGLIFEEYESESYPGGLTKPMWNALQKRFVSETHSKAKRAIARAVVGYCDGSTVRTFVGETRGTIADKPRGTREFYWDTVFIPDNPDGSPGSKTYAEIVEDPALGLEHKIVALSQSSKAMLQFLEYRRTNIPTLWSS